MPITNGYIHHITSYGNNRMLRSGDECFEYLDNCIMMMGYFTYCTDGISPGIWTLCGPLLKALDDWAFDYMSEIMVPILNFISKDINTFMQGHFEGKPYVLMLLEIIKKAFDEDT